MPSSNGLNTSDKLVITSSVTKGAHIRPCISLIRYHMQIYTSWVWLVYLSTFAVGNAVFQIKTDNGKISCFEFTIPGFGHPYNLLESKLIQVTLCRNARIQMNLSKNKYNCFSAEEAINYIPLTEKTKKVPVCEMFESSRSLSSPMLSILSWKLKEIAYRGSSTIHPSSKLELLYQ